MQQGLLVAYFDDEVSPLKELNGFDWLNSGNRLIIDLKHCTELELRVTWQTYPVFTVLIKLLIPAWNMYNYNPL